MMYSLYSIDQQSWYGISNFLTFSRQIKVLDLKIQEYLEFIRIFLDIIKPTKLIFYVL